jgi:hypothetical protein
VTAVKTLGEGYQSTFVREQSKRRFNDVFPSAAGIDELCACTGSQLRHRSSQLRAYRPAEDRYVLALGRATA